MKESTKLEVIQTDKAGLPVGPYRQGIKAMDLIFVAGQTGMDPSTKRVVPGGIEAETRQCLENVKSILEAAGSSMAKVIKTQVFMTNLKDFARMNNVYSEYLSLPGRTTVEVKRLPSNANVEITVTALIKDSLKVIKTDKAGPPVGPYSQGIKAGDFIYVAGEKGMDPNTNKIVPGGIEAETRQTLENIKAILEEAGSCMDKVVKTEVFMTNLNEFAKMNAIYSEYLSLPGRTTVQVPSLPAGASIEITATAVV